MCEGMLIIITISNQGNSKYREEKNIENRGKSERNE